MPLARVQSPDDPRLAPYRALKERDLARDGDRFIVEGDSLVRQLLASRFATESVLLAERRVDEIAPLVPADVPVFVASAELVSQLLGFKFHAGVMAVGVRGPSPTIDDVMGKLGAGERVTLLICPEVEKTDNLGALIRVGAAFGVRALILGERCCDPFFRQSVRVSMGAVFALPIVRSPDLVRDLMRLRADYGVELVASVLAADAQPLRGVAVPLRAGVLLGNEAQGLGAGHLALCDTKTTIPMKLGTDSLNVAAAAAVLLYHFTQE
jgi:tRNA G18 (ribose-2'-O)-methylase SpoU